MATSYFEAPSDSTDRRTARTTAFIDEVLGFEFLGLTNLADGEPYYAELNAGGRKFGLHEIVFAFTDSERHRMDPW